MNMKASWLYSKNPLVVDKDLATVIGLNEAITLQQINYWLHVPGGKNVDGKHWIKHTVSEFLEKDFPFWSRNTARRAIASCEKKGFLLKRNLNNAGFDKSKWYSINEVKLDEVMSHAFAQNGPTSDPKWANGVAQNEQTYTRDSPENTSETTTTNNDSSPAKQDEQTIPYKETVDYLNQKTSANYKSTTKPTVKQITKEFEFIWDKYPKKKGKKVAYSHYKAWRKTNPAHNTPQYLIKRLNAYIQHLTKDHTPEQYVLNGSTWFNGRFDDVLDVDKVQAKHGGFDKRLFENVDANTDDLPF